MALPPLFPNRRTKLLIPQYMVKQRLQQRFQNKQ